MAGLDLGRVAIAEVNVPSLAVMLKVGFACVHPYFGSGVWVLGVWSIGRLGCFLGVKFG